MIAWRNPEAEDPDFSLSTSNSGVTLHGGIISPRINPNNLLNCQVPVNLLYYRSCHVEL